MRHFADERCDAAVVEVGLVGRTDYTNVFDAKPVTVTSFAGSSAVPATYTYEACKVPKLGGNSLTSAKHRLKAAGCRLGKVSTKDGATPQSGVVAAQQPKPGRLAGTGTKVAVTLGP